MYRVLIVFLFVTFSLQAQTTADELKVDSLTYSYYLNGEWAKLIDSGEKAIQNNISFKYLHQRLGYAYFMIQNNYKAIKHYKAALKYDENDLISHTYLYYAAMQVGDADMANYHASKFDSATVKSLNLRSFKPIEAVDIEFNYKKNDALSDPSLSISNLRSNPTYIRVGLSSQPTFRFNIYQSVSRYNQTLISTTDVVQNEYYILLTYNLFSRSTLHVGYHHVKTLLDDATNNYSNSTRANVFLGGFSQRLGRFNVGLSSSVITGDTLQSQVGAYVGLTLPGSVKPYFKTSIYTISRGNETRQIFSQSAGMLATKRLWIEADITVGDLTNFVDKNGLYIYNSMDATKFRTGLSAFWYASPKITLFTNYTLDKKHITYNQTTYNQHSISGGLIWKL